MLLVFSLLRSVKVQNSVLKLYYFVEKKENISTLYINTFLDKLKLKILIL